MSVPSRKIIHVLLPTPFDGAFSYESEHSFARGEFVDVPFGKRTLTGVVWGESDPSLEDSGGDLGLAYKLKTIISKHDLPPLSSESMKFIDWVASYYMAPRGMVMKMMMSEPSVFKPLKRAPKDKKALADLSKSMTTLSGLQKVAADSIKKCLGSFRPILLEGVTGSGKTEVYLDAIADVLNRGEQSLVLLPEIALSTQWLRKFEERFGETPVLWHSELTPAQRRNHWKAVISGKARVVVGARSALFLPFQNLGMIVVDEEHDPGYKQDAGVLYHARDMAVMRGSFENAPVVLASATPSLETLENASAGKYLHLKMDERYGEATLPEITLIDRRHKNGKSVKDSRWISEALHAAIKDNMAQKNQSLLFLNRRGYAPMLLCGECGVRVSCKACDTWLVYHKHDQSLKCHQCGFAALVPKTCASCRESGTLIPCGPGVERVVEEISSLFPTARVALMTSDTMNTYKKAKALVEAVHNSEVDIIVGTQVMAKGHHFPNLTLVGVVDGDIGLSGSDLRLMERTYQLMHQVSGRAGRADKKGQVMIQSHMTDHPLMKALASGNIKDFLSFEREMRGQFGFPPFGRLAAIILSSKNKEAAEGTAKEIGKLKPMVEGVDIFGPVPAVFHKLNHAFRWRFLVKGPKEGRLQPLLAKWLGSLNVPSHVRIQIDIDPFNFY